MICNGCFEASPIPSCTDTLILGEPPVDSGLTEVNVFFHFSPSGNTQMYTGQVDEFGHVEVLSPELPTGGYVKIWVNNPAVENFTAALPLTIDGSIYTCIEAQVERLHGVVTLIHDVSIVE